MILYSQQRFLCFKPVPVTSKKANSRLSQIVYELKLTYNTNKSYKNITKLYLTNNDCILQTLYSSRIGYKNNYDWNGNEG